MSATKARTVILTGGVATITALGAWYGAGLKTQQEIKEARKQVVEATIEDKIALLEARREHYVGKRNEIQRKISQVQARRNGEQETT